MEIKLQDGTIVGEAEFRASMPNVSMPAVLSKEVLAQFGAVAVMAAPQPSYDSATQRVVRNGVVLDALGNYIEAWEVMALPAGEVAALAAAKVAGLMSAVADATQARLDAFAKTRNYDSILSACTYAGSSVPQFANEGQYCLDMRDQTWAALYTLLAEVQAGTHPMPTGFADVEPLLPELVWPA